MVKLKRGVNISEDITFEDDVLNRKPYGESLANLIDNSDNDSLVISINSNWGEGKSFFLHMWKNFLITEREYKVIYFDAFKNDFIDDPFVALLGEMMKSYKDDATSLQSITDKGKNVLKSIIPLSGKIGARFLLGGDIESVEDHIEGVVEGDIAQFVGKTIKEYTDKDNQISTFKSTLEEIIEEKGKVIFIIDELDRCRPDFAVRLLERIKHFFDIKGLYFILGINKTQLEKYIVSVYGDIDANTYLHKFIDIETVLPKILTENRGEDHYEKFIKSTLSSHSTILGDKLDANYIEYIERLFLNLAKPLGLTLRDIEKVANYLAIFYKSLGPRSYHLPMTVLFLIITKLFNADIYKGFKEGTINKEKVELLLKLDLSDENYKEDFERELSFIFDEEVDAELVEHYRSVFRSYAVHGIERYSTRRGIVNYHFQILESFNINSSE